MTLPTEPLITAVAPAELVVGPLAATGESKHVVPEVSLAVEH
jgi:hypothetical protein